ncbi:ferrous iron transport protein A [bacterium]|nr:ferrous iron transport protein A [bacterium]
MTLLDLPDNTWARVESVDGEESLSRRLLEMGFTEGECIRVVAASPFRDPLAVNIRGAVFALRKYEAGSIRVCLL